MEERKIDEFEDDRKKWKIYFDLSPEVSGGEKVIDVRFRLNREVYSLTENDMKKLKQDLRDLGKLRIIKQGKEFLDNCKEVK
ncbi:hypothetical protein K8R47_03030 [archaeon]|nr:hypothetical protein [archaeon]